MLLFFIYGFFLGTCLFGIFHPLINNAWLIGIIVLSIALKSLIAHEALKKGLWFMLAISIGFFWTNLYAAHVNRWHLPLADQPKNIIASGYIASIPHYHHRRVQFNFQLATFNGKPLNALVRLNWYGRYPRLQAGQRWQLTLRLRSSHLSNSYQRWLYYHHIRANGYVVAKLKNRLINDHWYDYPLTRLRERLAVILLHNLHGEALHGLIPALVVGYKSSITPSQWQVFRATGTSHLMAISGLHIGLVSGFVFGLINLGWRLLGRLCLFLPAPKAAAIGAIIAALLYSALAGFALPTQRACVMIIVFMLGTLSRYYFTGWQGYSVALLIVVAINPLSYLSASFWLSFGAVGFLLYGLNNRLKPRSLWWQWGRAQWVISFGLAPLSLILFGQVSLIGFFANLIAIPFVECLVIPLVLLGGLTIGLTSYAKWLLLLSLKLMSVIWWLLSKMAKLPYHVLEHHVKNDFAVSAAFIGIILLLAPKGFKGRWLGLLLLLPFFLSFV